MTTPARKLILQRPETWVNFVTAPEWAELGTLVCRLRKLGRARAADAERARREKEK